MVEVVVQHSGGTIVMTIWNVILRQFTLDDVHNVDFVGAQFNGCAAQRFAAIWNDQLKVEVIVVADARVEM